MAIRFHSLGVRAAALVAAAILLVAPAPACRAQSDETPPVVTIESLGLGLDRIELLLRRKDVSDAALAGAREDLDPLRELLRNRIETLKQSSAEIEAGLKQLGAAPAADKPPEDAALADERARLDRRAHEADAAARQAGLLATRAESLADQIASRRREIFARRLLARSSSIFDPSFWGQFAEAVPRGARSFTVLARSWWNHAVEVAGPGKMAAALAILAALAAAIALYARWWRRWRASGEDARSRFAKVLSALIALVRTALTVPGTVVAIVLILDAFALMPAHIGEIASGLVIAVAVASFGRGVSNALFAPDEPARRLFQIDDGKARLIARHLNGANRVLGVAIFFSAFQKATSSPISATVALNMLSAAAILVLLVHLLLRARRRALELDDVEAHRGQWLRGFGWLLATAILAALATGYVGLAAFLAGRTLVVFNIFGALYILLVFIDVFLTDELSAQSRRGRAVAAFIGLKPANFEMIATLLSAVLRILLIFLVILPLLGRWGIFAADYLGLVRDAAFGIHIGEITISITAVVSAVIALFIGVLLTRLAQGWLQKRFLPRTGIESSLQHSVATIFGYLGIIAALTLALATLGIDLQKITLVAGALSIGIGFGLQSIVSNFVSGLILLTERPIRVGDWIVVKGEEGYVRRIKVRATEIETFERASVIIPNSELISGVVKNWTHVNTLGRITVKVGVGYESDAVQVRDILLDVAQSHAGVLKSPQPLALFVGFGDSALDFELRCVVAKIQELFVIRSDLCFAILERFRAAGVVIPYPQRELSWRDGAKPGLEPPQGG